jgi:hypothetical protein
MDTPLLNHREAPKFFDIREILQKKEAATDTTPYFFKKSTEGGVSIGISTDSNSKAIFGK